MPILHLGADGEIFEVDSSENNSTRVGSTAQYVEDDDLLKLSIKEDPQVLKDRQKIDELKAIQHHHAILGQIQLAKSAALERQAKEKILFQKQQTLKAKEAKLQERETEIMAKAIATSTFVDEVWSGVSGNGLTSDGRRPYLDRPSLDWRLFENVSSDFGNTDTDNAQDDFDFGPLTETDKYIINEYQAGRYSVTLENYSPNGDRNPGGDTVYRITPDVLRNMEHQKADLTPQEIQRSNERGWMYSAIKDDSGNWQPIRVPLAYGLIAYDPTDTRNGGAVRLSRLSSLFIGNPAYPQTRFELLRPVILAYHKQLIANEERTRYLEELEARDKVEQATPAIVEQEVAQEKLNEVYENTSHFNHPMLSFGLIPKRRK